MRSRSGFRRSTFSSGGFGSGALSSYAFNRRDFLRRAGTLLLIAPAIPALRSAGFALPGTVDPAGPALVEKYCHTMGSVASISVYGPDRRACEEAIAEAFALMKRVDTMMSSHDPASALNGVNAAAGRAGSKAPEDLIRVLEAARRYHAVTGGAFDVTVGPLLELYGFFRETDAVHYPGDRTIAASLEAVGFGTIEVDAQRSTVGLIHPRSRIDLGGIGVGFALDLAAGALRKRGIEAALLNHSGDILAMGMPPGTKGWEIGIQDPEDPGGTVTSFLLNDRSVSTSGNYENFVETDRGKVGHILDPATGINPAKFLSVSVLAGTSLAADALSTGFFTGGVRLSEPPPADAGTISVFTVGVDGDRRVTEYHPDVRA